MIALLFLSLAFCVVTLCTGWCLKTTFQGSRRSDSHLCMVDRKLSKPLLASFAIFTALSGPLTSLADSNSPSTQGSVEKIALYSKKSTDVQNYVDITRGFKMLRYG